MALCICCQRVSRRYIAGWRGSSENPAFFSRCTKESNVDPAEVAKNGGLGDRSLLLPEPFPSFRLKTLRFTWHRKRERRCQCDSPTPRECSPAENAYTAADQAEYQRHAPSRRCRRTSRPESAHRWSRLRGAVAIPREQTGEDNDSAERIDVPTSRNCARVACGTLPPRHPTLRHSRSAGSGNGPGTHGQSRHRRASSIVRALLSPVTAAPHGPPHSGRGPRARR